MRALLGGLAEEHPLFRLYYLGFDAYLHQAELVYRLALRRPVRALIADEIGLGKTVEALMVADWGLRKGLFRGARILVLVPRSLVGQWEAEALRAGLRSLLDVKDVGHLRPESGDSRKVFILKIDTVKKGRHKQRVLEHGWDLVIVDEAHKLGRDTERLELVKELVERNPGSSLLLLSATPHTGDEREYLELLRMIDPVDVKSLSGPARERYYGSTIGSLVFRRSKAEVNEVYEGRRVFVDAELVTRSVELREVERRYIERLDSLTRELVRMSPDKPRRRVAELLGVLIDKRGLSSFYSGLLTFRRLLEKLGPSDRWGEPEDREALELAVEYVTDDYLSKESPDDLAERVASNRRVASLLRELAGDLEELADLAERALAEDSKLRVLRELMREHLGKGDVVVVFTDYSDTAEYVYSRLKEELKRTFGSEVMLLTGRVVEGSEILERVKKWLSAGGPRVLVSTDVASEGLNLQHANVVVNFELPWSLTKLEQRAGRVWRLGQRRDVRIYLMVMDHGFERMVFEALYRKLAESVRAGIVPSTLAIFKPSEESVSLPVSALAPVSPFELWRRYKEEGAEGVRRLVEDSLKKLRRRAMSLRRSRAIRYSHGSAPPTVPLELERVVGFRNRDELESFLCRAVRLLGETLCNEFFYRQAVRTSPDPRRTPPLYLVCSTLERPLLVLRSCAGLEGSPGEACWVLGYFGDGVWGPGEALSLLEGVSSRGAICEVLGQRGFVRRLAEEAVERELALARERIVAHMKQNVLPVALKGLIDYAKLRREWLSQGAAGRHYLRPASIDEVRVSADLLVALVPGDEVYPRVRELAEREVDEALSEAWVGSVTEEKLEVERQGLEALMKALKGRFLITYVGDLRTPFDLVLRDPGSAETRLVELKTLVRMELIVLTEGEEEFARRLEREGHEYWLYVVDLRRGEVRSYRHPLETGKLRRVLEVLRNGRRFFVYEEAGEPDERALLT